MAWNNRIVTSIFGRRLGLMPWGPGGKVDLLVGPEALRVGVSTAETTSANLRAFGYSMLNAASSAVFTLDPPIPGITKIIQGSTAGPYYVKTMNNEVISTTAGSSFTTVKISSFGGCFELIGLTTAKWGSHGITTGTTAQASGFSLSTTT